MSAMGDLLINIGQTLPETLRKRKQEEDAKKRQVGIDSETARQRTVQDSLNAIALKKGQNDLASTDQETKNKTELNTLLDTFSKKYGSAKNNYEQNKNINQIDTTGVDTSRGLDGHPGTNLITGETTPVTERVNTGITTALGDNFSFDKPGQSVSTDPAIKKHAMQLGRDVANAQPGIEASKTMPTRTGLFSELGGLRFSGTNPEAKKMYDTFEKQDENDLSQSGKIAAAQKDAERLATLQSDAADHVTNPAYLARINAAQSTKEAEDAYDKYLDYEKTIQAAKLSNDNKSANRDLTMGTKKDQWTEDQWQKFEKRTNSLNTTGRSALGQSGVANVRAARAMDVLVNKDIVSDPYVYDLANTDIQGIMKGGSPTNEQLKEKYANAQTALASLWGKITSNPQEINQPGVKKQLLTIIGSLRDIDNDVLDKNLGVAKVAFKKIIKDDPDRAVEFFSALEGTKDVFPSTVSNPATTQTKVIGGVTYKKVPGGWEPQ